MIHSRALSKVCATAVVIGGIQCDWIIFSPVAKAQTIQPSGSDTIQAFGPGLLLTAAHYTGQATETSDGKSTKNVETTQEAQPSPWSVYANAGYTSEYNFRGTNLTPDSNGAGFLTANVSYGGFTFGIYGIAQFGTARANSFSIGEGGGGGGVAVLANVPGVDNSDNNLHFTGTISPETTQRRFNELDVYVSYTHELGPLDITVGNIAFFIDRDAVTRITTRGVFVDGEFINGVLTDINGDQHIYPLTGQLRETVDVNTVGYEAFDRLYIAVSAPRLFHSDIFNIVPKVYYYQTVVNAGPDPFKDAGQVIVAHDLAPQAIEEAEEGFPHFFAIHGVSERNDSLGGYLEGRIDANFKVSDRITVQPYGLISVSFHDRTEPYENPKGLRQFIRSRSLVGFNNAQVGVKVPIELWRSHGPSGPAAALTVAPFGAYSYHISNPPIGTDRNEVWGGGQFELTF